MRPKELANVLLLLLITLTAYSQRSQTLKVDVDLVLVNASVTDERGPQSGGRHLIEELSDLTGGRAFFPNSIYDLDDICTKIAIELKNQYMLGYRSTHESADGKWRKVNLKISPPAGLPNLSVRAKTGYYGPVR